MPKGIMSDMNKDITVTMKGRDGGSVTYKSPAGSSMDMGGIMGGMVPGYAPSPVADNKQINVTPGEFVVNVPAAQKYSGILNKINNEGRQMLAQGGYAGKPQMGMNYNQGGLLGSPASYDQLQEDLPYIEEQLQAGTSPEELAKYYGVTTEAFYDATAGVHGGNGPIVSSGNPAQAASSFAEANGLDHSDTVMETLESLAKEAIQDWASLPPHEKKEWGSIDELIDYYMNDGATEAGLYDSHYVADQNFNQGGMVGKLRDTLVKNAEFVSRVKAAFGKGLSHDQIVDAALKNPRVSGMINTDMDTWQLEQAIASITGGTPVEGYWTGGEVGKGDPEEGDTFSHKGQNVTYKNGSWVYKSGSAAPGYVVQAITAANDAFKEAPVEGEAPAEQKSNITAVEKETHAKNYAWGKRAIEAEKVIRELTQGGFNPASFEYAKGETAANFLGDIARTEEGQRYKKAVESLVAAVLRKDTGAAIAADEFDRTYRQLFPSFGTGEKAQADAANQRKQNIEGFISASGPGAGDLTEQLGNLLETPSTSDSPIFTGQDYGGMIGGTALGIAGGIFGGPLGAAIGSGTGTYLGRTVGQMLTSDDTLLESLTPEASDVIDTALSSIGGGALKIGSNAWKAAKAAIARRAAQKGTKDARALSDIAGEVAEKGLIKGVASAVSGKAGAISGKITPHIGQMARKEGWQYANVGSKPFFRKLDGTIIDGVTGSITKGRTATQVNKALGPIKQPF